MGLDVLGLSCTTANLWEEEVDTEWSILVLEEALELGNLLTEHVWSVADTADDTDTAGVGDGGGELRPGGDVHAGKHDWVLDLEEIGGGGANLLCRALLLVDVARALRGIRGWPAYEGRPWLRYVCMLFGESWKMGRRVEARQQKETRVVRREKAAAEEEEEEVFDQVAEQLIHVPRLDDWTLATSRSPKCGPVAVAAETLLDFFTTARVPSATSRLHLCNFWSTLWQQYPPSIHLASS